MLFKNDNFKEFEKEGPVLIKFYRYTGLKIASSLKGTGISPNHVTLLGLLFGVLAAWFFSYGLYLYTLLGILMIQLSFLMDYADGSLARMKNKSSKVGAWLDYFSANAVLVLVIFGLSWSMNSSITWMLSFILVSVSLMIKSMFSYFQNLGSGEVRMGMGISRNFYFNQANLFLILSVLGVLNLLRYFFIITSIFGVLFLIGMMFFFTRKVMKS